MTRHPGDDKPGMKAIKLAAALLAVLALVALLVSFEAQYQWLVVERHLTFTAALEAGLIDLTMIILALLAFGLARNGQKSWAVQIWIMVFAGLSALQNYAAADSGQWRSVLAFILPPIVLAILVDLTATTVRRHILHARGEAEPSNWLRAGQFALAAIAGATRVFLYLLRLCPGISMRATAGDLRQRIMLAAPTLAETDERTGLPAKITALRRQITTLTAEMDQLRTGHAAAIEQALDLARAVHGDELETVLRIQREILDARDHEHGEAIKRLRHELAEAIKANGHQHNGSGTGNGTRNGNGNGAADKLIADLVKHHPRQDGESIRAWLIRLYELHPAAGDSLQASSIATALGRATSSSQPTARAHIKRHLATRPSAAPVDEAWFS